jgi:hypothetical protein
VALAVHVFLDGQHQGGSALRLIDDRGLFQPL